VVLRTLVLKSTPAASAAFLLRFCDGSLIPDRFLTKWICDHAEIPVTVQREYQESNPRVYGKSEFLKYFENLGRNHS
jgi:hypothetical protein